MAALASVEDLIVVAGAVDEARAPRLLEMASAKVERYCNRSFAFVANDTVTLTPGGDRVRLPSGPVTAVSAVTSSDGASVDWTLAGDYLSFCRSNPQTYPHGCGCASLTVTYSHGYDPIPDDIISVVCEMVGRALAGDIGVGNESLGSYSVGLRSGTGTTVLTDDDKAALSGYVVQPGSLQMVRG